MYKLKGNPVAAGVAIGKAKIIGKPELNITRRKILSHEIGSELDKFNSDLKFIINELDKLIEDYNYSKENRDILESHKMILEDPQFHTRVTELISEELLSLEHAISKYFTEVSDIFDNMDNPYLTHRASDLEDVAYRLLSHVMNVRKDLLNDVDDKSILIMENITPSFVTKVFEKNIRGLCTEKGSKNSHSSIIARSMNLPMLVNTIGLLTKVKDDDSVIIDGNDGLVIVSPTKAELQKYQQIFVQEQNNRNELLKLIDLEAVTKGGKKIELMSNIEIPQEIDQVLKFKSSGIGLFRTEFLFIDREDLPTEDEQYTIYKEISEKSAPHSVIIRTIDVGGDKLSSILNITHEENPNLGCRGIRISLQNVPIFKQQIKAILRANSLRNIKIMFPMISGVNELRKIKDIMDICKSDLKKNGIEFYSDIQIGVMIEIPSAVITSDALAEECDFLSIGTNDLIQYTLAVDRDNSTISDYYQSTHPSIFRLIKYTVENAHKKGKKVAICGEMASDKELVKYLLALEIDELSVSPGRLLLIKKEILNTDLAEAKIKLEKILVSKTAEEVNKIIRT
ncbi:MAG: phosphoenolpyruvate--protein phosphotransferase [Candidatus Cloacimonetes bacterium]|nr:phosphoenolpyruvate--protein phosphotransferase [Candidatus Cloacimonadota bacterium]